MLKSFALFLLVTVFIMACGEPSSTPESVKVDILPNGVQYGDLLFGGQPSEAMLETLVDQGYGTILSARPPEEISWDEKRKVESLGMTFINIPMAMPVTNISDQQVAQLNQVLSSADRPIMLHCRTGNRAAGLWAVWLVEYQHMAIEDALKLAKSVGMTDIQPVVEQRLRSASNP